MLAPQHGLRGRVPGTAVIWLVLIAIGLLSATHDIARGGWSMTALGRAGQARYTGIRVAAFRVAMLVGSGLASVFLGGRVHWLAGFGLGALLMVGLAVAHRVTGCRGCAPSAWSRSPPATAAGRLAGSPRPHPRRLLQLPAAAAGPRSCCCSCSASSSATR